MAEQNQRKRLLPKPRDPLTPYGNRPMVTPIVHAVNYEYASFEVLRQITDGEVDGYTYHRDDNPTVRAVECQIADLEDAEDCVICTTGMAACTLIFLTYLNAGDNLIIFHDVYGANYKVSLILERLGVEVTWLDAYEGDSLPQHVKPNTRMVFLETPTNPLVKVVDIAAACQAARASGAMVIVDNTFATPYHQKPLALGADLVVHSATKALGGHNDIMAGAICGSKELYNDLWFGRQAIGTTLDAFSASLLERGLKTFAMRSEKMSQNALAMAQFLAGHPKVPRILYPGLESDPGHAVALKQMSGGFGGVLAFDVGQTEDDAKNLITHLKKIVHAVSLGATESLICIPYLTTMLYLPEDRRLSFGVKRNTVRLSAGIEDADELVADLEQALKVV
jgi:cystathionine beta-lyase/cystathionine gamma-synthase